jgi:hypothetical protein
LNVPVVISVEPSMMDFTRYPCGRFVTLTRNSVTALEARYSRIVLENNTGTVVTAPSAVRTNSRKTVPAEELTGVLPEPSVTTRIATGLRPDGARYSSVAAVRKLLSLRLKSSPACAVPALILTTVAASICEVPG